MKITLVCDTRERAIQDAINLEFSAPNIFANTATRGTIECSVQQVEVGDYSILNGETVLAVFERKTLKDYASSIKDGRHNNKVKLLNFRNYTGCKVFYIIEGPLNPDYNSDFAGIEFRKIHASEHDLMLKDGIFIIRTQNGEHTARELKMLCESYLRAESETKVSDSFSAEKRETITYSEALLKCKLTPEEQLQKARVNAWFSLSRVGETTAAKIATEFKLSDWILGKIDVEKAKNFTYNDRKNNIVTTYLITKPTNELLVPVLSALKGFTKASSQELLGQVSLEDILLGKTTMHVTLGARGCKLTDGKKQKIIEFLDGLN
jgi:ERCC4-type nuclease